MKYTSEDIKILQWSPYEGHGLGLSYCLVDGNPTALVLPNDPLLAALSECEYIVSWDKSDETILDVWTRPWQSLRHFMEANLSQEMAEKLVLNYLNNKTVKP